MREGFFEEAGWSKNAVKRRAIDLFEAAHKWYDIFVNCNWVDTRWQ